MNPRSHKLPLAPQNKGSKFTTHGKNAGRASRQHAHERKIQNVMDGIFDELMQSAKKGKT